MVKLSSSSDYAGFVLGCFGETIVTAPILTLWQRLFMMLVCGWGAMCLWRGFGRCLGPEAEAAGALSKGDWEQAWLLMPLRNVVPVLPLGREGAVRLGQVLLSSASGLGVFLSVLMCFVCDEWDYFVCFSFILEVAL